jgi:hypothetical protein
MDYEKIQKEKVILENQLVVYKLKYAENSSKIMELEDEKDSLKKKYENCVDTINTKDEIIKNLIKERDSIKYTNTNTHNTNTHVPALDRINTSRNLKRGTTFNTESFYCHTDRDHTPTYNKNNINGKKSSYIITDTDIGNTEAYKNSKTPIGIVKMFKNIFNSDKK